MSEHIICTAPFFGVINGLFAAFTTTFATYCIPLYLYNKAFSEDQTKELKKQHPAIVQKLAGFKAIRWFNWLLGTAVLVCGVGFGGYSAMVSLIQEVDTFSAFPKCYTNVDVEMGLYHPL